MSSRSSQCDRIKSSLRQIAIYDLSSEVTYSNRIGQTKPLSQVEPSFYQSNVAILLSLSLCPG